MSVLDIDDFEIIEPAATFIQRSRAAWEAEQMAALRERRKARQPITAIEVARWQWKRLAALVPQTNARSLEIRQRRDKKGEPAPQRLFLLEAPALPADEDLALPAPVEVAPTPAPRKPRPRRVVEALKQEAPAPVVPVPVVVPVVEVVPDLTPPAPAPALLVQLPDEDLARRAGVEPQELKRIRRRSERAATPQKAPAPTSKEALAAQRREQIVALATEGKTDQEIASLLKVSSALVNMRRREAGIPQPEKARGVPEAEWPALYREGKSIKEIAALSGWCEAHVRRKLIEAGVEMRISSSAEALQKAAEVAAATFIDHISASERAAIRKLAADGVPARIISTIYKRKASEVRAIIAEEAS